MTLSHKLAAIIKRAQELHEASFDKEGAAKAQEKLAADPKAIVDFDQFYGTTKRVASASACADAGEPELTELVHTLLFNSWNDAGDWAASIK